MSSEVIKQILKTLNDDVNKDIRDDEELTKLVEEFDITREEYMKEITVVRSKYLSRFADILSRIQYLLYE